jgi:hypothetical protein
MGWDLAFTTSFAALNKAIADSGSSPKDMEFDGTAEDQGRLSGSFGIWQLAADAMATGQAVVVEIPFQLTSFEVEGKTFPNEHFPRKDFVFTADVVLAFALHETLQGGTKVKHLKTQAPDPKTLVNNSVSIRSASADALTIAIGNCLDAWLKQNIQTFTHVFSCNLVDFSQVNPVFDRLSPKGLAYAVKCPDVIGQKDDQQPDLSKCVFSVLCLLDREDTGDLIAQTDLSLLPKDCDAGIAVSSAVFLEHMLAPVFIGSLRPQNAVTFAMRQGDQPALVNTSDLVLPDFDLAGIDGLDSALSSSPGGTTVPLLGPKPTLQRENLQLRIDHNELCLDFLSLEFESMDRLNRFTIDYTGRFTAALTAEGHLTLSDSSKFKAMVSVSTTEVGRKFEIWSNAVVQTIVALLCLVPGGGAEKGIETAIEEGTVATERVAAEVADMSEVDLAETETEAEDQLLEGPLSKAANALKRYGPRVGIALGKGMLAMLAINVVSDLPSCLSFLRKKTANPAPTMHDLATAVMNTNLWNGHPTDHVTCASAEFDEGITIGIKFNAPARGAT